MSIDPRDKLLLAAAQELIQRRYKIGHIGNRQEDEEDVSFTFSSMLETFMQNSIGCAEIHTEAKKYQEAVVFGTMAIDAGQVIAIINNLAYAISGNENLALDDHDDFDPTIASSITRAGEIKALLQKIADDLQKFCLKHIPQPEQSSGFESARMFRTIMLGMVRDFETTIGKALPFQRDPTD